MSENKMSKEESVRLLEGILKFTAPLENNEKQALSFALEVLRRIDEGKLSEVISRNAGTSCYMAEKIVNYLTKEEKKSNARNN